MPIDPDALQQALRRLAPAADHVSLRVVAETAEITTVRQNVAKPVSLADDIGAMVTVVQGDGVGYAATSDLSDDGLRQALALADDWARLARGRSVLAGLQPQMPAPRGRFATPTKERLSWTQRERIDRLMAECVAAKCDDRIVDWWAQLWTIRSSSLLLTADGGQALQQQDITMPSLQVTAHAGGLTQTRSWGGGYSGVCQQGGAEVLAQAGFSGSGALTAHEALQLLAAPNCPSGPMDVLLMPDQMMLQIHESIGHPLELDRILGDERNYAGTSFVTLDLFGHHAYGSPLLNVTFDPSPGHELASFAHDDEGMPAQREHLIRNGILQRPLGGSTSLQRARQLRSDLDGVATTRACSWNRPPIDRMSNLNIEPGSSTLDEMIAATEHGVLMKTNRSWSIDDSRNKFQFGCEWGQMIRQGRLAEVVRDPAYRGISATFWRSLSMVGDARTVDVMGTPFCGKGEPSQVIRVGHASPACRFSQVDVFGAEH